MRKFVQSFVLAPQAAKKYYVHIDIFRYQDICPPTTESDAQPDEQYAEGDILLTPRWLIVALRCGLFTHSTSQMVTVPEEPGTNTGLAIYLE